MKTDEFKSIIQFAIDNEVESYEFYTEVSLLVKDDTLKETFEDLAKEELEHREFLKDFLSSGIKEIKLDEFKDYKIADTIEKPQLSVKMNFQDAISLAVKKEQEAMDMYNGLADICLEEDQRQLFLGLMKMEQMHKAKLEDIYINVAFGEVW